MFPANTWCFDLEIVNAICGKGETPVPGIRYCGGWGDHAGMGISVLVAARPDGSEVSVFIGDPFPESNLVYNDLRAFQDLVRDAELLVGHNSISFDAKVLAARGIMIPPKKHLDFYHEVKLATRNQFPRGYKLDELSRRCGGPGKSGDGALAPHDWQRGKHQQVIDYCKNDIVMTCAIAAYYRDNNGKVPSSQSGYDVQLRAPALLG